MNWAESAVCLGILLFFAWCAWLVHRENMAGSGGYQPSRKIGTGPNVAEPPEYGKPPCTPHGQGTKPTAPPPAKVGQDSRVRRPKGWSGYKVDPVSPDFPPPPK